MSLVTDWMDVHGDCIKTVQTNCIDGRWNIDVKCIIHDSWACWWLS